MSFQDKEIVPLAQNPSLTLIIAGVPASNQAIFQQDIQDIKEKLSVTKPFDCLIGKINLSFLETEPAEGRVLFRRQQGVPPLGVRSDVLKYLTNKKGTFKLIVIDYEGQQSCAQYSSIDTMSVVIIGRARYATKEDFLESFLHELGHSLGLRDECVNCAEQKPGYPNCAPTRELAEQWWGKFTDMSQGIGIIPGCCGRQDYFRPTIASLMNNPNKASGYGIVNEAYLKQEFLRVQNKARKEIKR